MNETERFRQALQDIADPVGYLRRTMEPGYVLDGRGAVAFAENAANLQAIARAALETQSSGGGS
jgi:hypothetical protein